MQGETDYYNKTSGAGRHAKVEPGYDFWANRTQVPRDETYTMSVYTAEAKRLTTLPATERVMELMAARREAEALEAS